MTWPAGAPPKDELRRMLRAAHPWLDDADWGPRNVEAGECTACGVEARLVLTCGPDGGQIGRDCAATQGVGAWCEGHHEVALAALDWLAALPDDADQVARLWWLATGEVRPGAAEQAALTAATWGQPTPRPQDPRLS